MALRLSERRQVVSEVAIETDCLQLIEALKSLAGEGAVVAGERRGLDGITLVTILITLSPAIIASVTKLIKSSIESKKHVRVIKDGMTVEGVSESTLLKLMSDD